MMTSIILIYESYVLHFGIAENPIDLFWPKRKHISRRCQYVLFVLRQKTKNIYILEIFSILLQLYNKFKFYILYYSAILRYMIELHELFANISTEYLWKSQLALFGFIHFCFHCVLIYSIKTAKHELNKTLGHEKCGLRAELQRSFMQQIQDCPAM